MATPKANAVLVRFPDGLLEIIDQARGDIPRNKFIVRACESVLRIKWDKPQPAEPDGVVEIAPGVIRTFGPQKAAPGSRLKKR